MAPIDTHSRYNKTLSIRMCFASAIKTQTAVMALSNIVNARLRSLTVVE